MDRLSGLKMVRSTWFVRKAALILGIEFIGTVEGGHVSAKIIQRDGKSASIFGA